MARVVISINGGNIVAVHSDIPGIEVELFDWDNIRSEREDMEEEEADTHLEAMEDRYEQTIVGLNEVVI